MSIGSLLCAAAHCRHGGGYVKKHGFFNKFSIYAQLNCFNPQIDMLDSCFKSWWVFDAVRAAVTASKRRFNRFFNCAYIGKFLKNPCFFYKSAAVAAVGGSGGGANLILRIAYVVRSIYFNFQPNRTIFTMFSPRTDKTTH